MIMTCRSAAVLGVLVAAASLSHGAAAADLSCSSSETKGALGTIFSKAILSEVPADKQDKVTLTGALENIRTVSSTSRESLCRATLSSHASFNGVAPAAAKPKVVHHDMAEIDAAVDAVMTSAAVDANSRQLIHQTDMYRGVKADWLATLPLSTAVYQVLSDGGSRRGPWWDALEQTSAYKALKNAESAEGARDRTARSTQAEFDEMRFAAARADRKAVQLSGEIEYIVEATDDGHSYITVRGRPN